MGLIFKNVLGSLNGYKRIYVILIISQIISVGMLFFAYGIFGSSTISQKKYTFEQKSFVFSFNEYKTAEEINPTIMRLLDKFEDELNYFMLGVVRDEVGGFEIGVYNEYNNGKFSYSKYIDNNTPLIAGRYPTEDEYNSGAKVAVISDDYEIGSVVKVWGTEYEIIGNVAAHIENLLYVSYKSLPEEYEIRYGGFMFNILPTNEDYEIFQDEFKRDFGEDVRIQPFEAVETENIIAMKTTVVVSVVIGILAALDTVLLYKYILDKRKKNMAIMGICGAKRIHRIIINEGEIFIITLITAVTGVVIFRIAFENAINRVYENMYNIYTPEVYVMMTGIYIISVVIITFILSICTSGNRFIKNRGR